MLNVYNYHTNPSTLTQYTPPGNMADLIEAVADVLHEYKTKELSAGRQVSWTMYGDATDTTVTFFIKSKRDDGSKSSGFITCRAPDEDEEDDDEFMIKMQHNEEVISVFNPYDVDNSIDTETIVAQLNILMHHIRR